LKILFINHSSNTIYGAAKSLQYILKNYECEFDYVYPNSFFHPVSKEVMKKYIGQRNISNRIYCLYLPFASGVCMDNKYNLKEKIYLKIKKVFEILDLFKLNKIIKNGNYDYIYLNSLVLYPMISKKKKFIIHLREVFTGNDKLYINVNNKLEHANKIIFIDEATRGPFKNLKTKNLVLNNPFDMRIVDTVIIDEVLNKYNIQSPKDKTIFSILGIISYDKGIDFLINAFKKSQRQDCILLIVGDGNADYVEYCKNLARDDKRIMFLGETKKSEEIYAISDYIIRADLFFAIGRTVYEGLYSGCDIIMQSDKDDDINKIFEKELFVERIHFYGTRNIGSLVNLINKSRKVKKQDRKKMSNISEYVISLNDFLVEQP